MHVYSGVALTDDNVMLRFFKPLPSGYTSRLVWWEKDVHFAEYFYKELEFGPVVGFLRESLAPSTIYRFRMSLQCGADNTTRSSQSKISVTTKEEGKVDCFSQKRYF